VERGEVWTARLDEVRPVVLLSGPDPEFRAVQVVAPATPAEKRGFVVMSGEQARDAGERRRILAAAGPDVRASGIEVAVTGGVVRLALPRAGTIFCTWELTVAGEHLVERIGVLSPAKLDELDAALALAAGHGV
jgi:mRNA interferase MazF